jgi:hypothetical protein
MCLLVCVGILFFPGCKTADPASYTLTVSVSNGVIGIPATGSYSYAENDTVSYNYSAQAGYGNLAVTLDGAPVANSGVITMTASHTLAVTAVIDVRGIWTGRFYYLGDDCYFTVTFSGGVLSGATYGMFDWEGAYVNGNFTLSGNDIEFNLIYPSGNAELACTGTLSNPNAMSGDWIWYENNIEEANGTWDLAR